MNDGWLDDAAGHDAIACETTPPRTRTWDPLIKNQMPPSVSACDSTTYDNKPPTPRASPSSGAQNPGISGIQDQQLRTIIEAWPMLPESVRAAVAAMVAAVRHEA